MSYVKRRSNNQRDVPNSIHHIYRILYAERSAPTNMRHLAFTRRHATTTVTTILIILQFVIHVQCWCGISTAGHSYSTISTSATTAATKSKPIQQSPKIGTPTTMKMNENHSNEGPDEPHDVHRPTLPRPTMRNFKTTTSSATTTATTTQSTPETARRDMQSYTQAMLERHEQMKPFTTVEIDIILNSLRNVIPISNDESNHTNVNDTMRAMLQELQDRVVPQYAHLSHKNWTMTDENAKQWQATLFPTVLDNNNNAPPQRHMFERIYREGNWDGAVLHHHRQQQLKDYRVKPWAVLVTGVNGIRKTTSIYQDWFPLLLQEAIVSPRSESDRSTMDQTLHVEISNLPCGSNTFFRQLDHMIATLCNEEFIRLYTFARDMLVVDGKTQHPQQPTSDIIQLYSNLKAAIFSRYRTISELLGVILLREAQRIPINCMVETSGRDVAMFHYIDHFFPASTYQKLALHFTINDLDYAKTSVDQRMIDEIQSGVAALDKNSIFDIINTNVGGPYGSEVLSAIQADSDRVWKENVMVDDGGVGHDWYKATIQINAHASEPWTAQAVKPDGSLGTIFQFQRK